MNYDCVDKFGFSGIATLLSAKHSVLAQKLIIVSRRTTKTTTQRKIKLFAHPKSNRCKKVVVDDSFKLLEFVYIGLYKLINV